MLLPLGLGRFARAVAAVFCLTAASTSLPSPTASAEPEFVSSEFLVDWLSRARTICYNRDLQANTCAMVAKVMTLTERQTDWVVFMADRTQGLKITIALRQQFDDEGLCWKVPQLAELAINFYQTTNNIGDVVAGDVLLPLTQTQREQLLPSLLAGMGFNSGDLVCSRYVVHEKDGDEVQSLREITSLNGSELKGGEESILHFYGADAQLPLAPAS